MIKIIKKIALLLILALMVGATQAVAAEPHVFDALYMIVGTVSANGAPGGANGRTVIFYKSYPDVVAATVEAGQYVINIYDNMDVDIDSLDTYYVAVEQSGDGWGGTPEAVTLSSNGWMTVNLGLADGAGPGASTEAADDGWIVNTEIERVSGDIRLTWTYNGVSNADVWRASGEAGYAFSSTETYAKLNASPISGTSFDDPDIHVGDGKNAYYRVVPSGLSAGEIFGESSGTAYNKRTVGKTDISLEAEYNAICHPFNSDYINIPTLVGEQLQEGDQIHWWNQPTQAYQMATKVSGDWNALHNFEFADGFFVYVSGSPTYLTLVGLVDNFVPNITKPLLDEYNLVGYPYPVIKNGDSVGFAPREGDQIHKWNAAGQAFTMSTYVSGNWNNITVTTFEVGDGKFYYAPTSQGPYDWQLDF